jgi:hypothetical protein
MTQDKQDEPAIVLKKRADLSREYCQPYFDRFIDNYEHYFIRTIDKDVEANQDAYPFYSQIMIPISYQVVETILPRMFGQMFSFSLETEAENDRHDEFAFENLVRYQIDHPYLIDDPFMSRLIVAMKEEFITGNAWFRVPWITQKEKIQQWQPYSPELGLAPSEDFDDVLEICKEMGIEPKWKLAEVNKKVFDAPMFQHRSIFQVLPDPKKKRVGDLGWIIDEEMMTMDEVMTMVNSSPRQFENIDQLKKLHEAKDLADRSGNQTDYMQELADIFGSKDYSDKDDTQHQFKVSTMSEKNKLTVVINEKLTIREGSNPNGDGKIGYGLMKDVPIPHELYAWGEIDPIKRLEDGQSDQFNMRNDDVFYDLMRMWQVDPTALVEGVEFIPEPGAIIEMKPNAPANAIKPLDKTPTPASAYREFSEWENIIQGVSGVTEYATGENKSGMNPTLGGVEKLQAAANNRFALKLNLFENLALSAIGTYYIQRNIRYFDEETPVNTRQGKMIVTPESIRRLRGAIRFKVTAGSTEAQNLDKEWMRWKIVAEMAGDPNNPIFANLVPESYDTIAKGMLNSLRVPNSEDLVKRAQTQPGSVDPLTGQPRNTIANLNPDGSRMDQAQLEALAAQGEVGGANVQPNTPTVQPGVQEPQTI